jgi:mannose-6-phosphate isomerase-like protein (cupin superfamily)
MKGYVANIEEATVANEDFRRVLYTGKNIQLVLMTLQPGEEIGEEVHEDRDQFFRIEEGQGTVYIDGAGNPVEDDFAVIVPAGARHNVVNTGSEPCASTPSTARPSTRTPPSTRTSCRRSATTTTTSGPARRRNRRRFSGKRCGPSLRGGGAASVHRRAHLLASASHGTGRGPLPASAPGQTVSHGRKRLAKRSRRRAYSQGQPPYCGVAGRALRCRDDHGTLVPSRQ